MDITKKIDEIKCKLEISKYKYWWHYFLAVNEKSGEEKAFFIQYYVVNPELSAFKPNFSKPSYAMIRAGTWEDGGIQVNNFYGGNYFNIKNYNDESQIVIGHCIVSEKYLKGKVYLGEKCAKIHDEFMCDCGEFSWEIQKKNRTSYIVENNIINIASKLERFSTEYEGYITYNGQKYSIRKSMDNGYEIKASINTDIGFWINLNCTSFKNEIGEHEKASLNLIGLSPILFKKKFNKEFSLILNLNNKEYKYSTGVLGNRAINKLDYGEEDDKIWMNLKAFNEDSKIEMYFEDEKENIMKMFYRQPGNESSTLRLWNSAYSKGYVKLYEKQKDYYVLKNTLSGNKANLISYANIIPVYNIK